MILKINDKIFLISIITCILHPYCDSQNLTNEITTTLSSNVPVNDFSKSTKSLKNVTGGYKWIDFRIR